MLRIVIVPAYESRQALTNVNDDKSCPGCGHPDVVFSQQTDGPAGTFAAGYLVPARPDGIRRAVTEY